MCSVQHESIGWSGLCTLMCETAENQLEHGCLATRLWGLTGRRTWKPTGIHLAGSPISRPHPERDHASSMRKRSIWMDRYQVSAIRRQLFGLRKSPVSPPPSTYTLIFTIGSRQSRRLSIIHRAGISPTRKQGVWDPGVSNWFPSRNSVRRPGLIRADRAVR